MARVPGHTPESLSATLARLSVSLSDDPLGLLALDARLSMMEAESARQWCESLCADEAQTPLGTRALAHLIARTDSPIEACTSWISRNPSTRVAHYARLRRAELLEDSSPWLAAADLLEVWATAPPTMARRASTLTRALAERQGQVLLVGLLAGDAPALAVPEAFLMRQAEALRALSPGGSEAMDWLKKSDAWQDTPEQDGLDGALADYLKARMAGFGAEVPLATLRERATRRDAALERLANALAEAPAEERAFVCLLAATLCAQDFGPARARALLEGTPMPPAYRAAAATLRARLDEGTVSTVANP